MKVRTFIYKTIQITIIHIIHLHWRSMRWYWINRGTEINNGTRLTRNSSTVPSPHLSLHAPGTYSRALAKSSKVETWNSRKDKKHSLKSIQKHECDLETQTLLLITRPFKLQSSQYLRWILCSWACPLKIKQGNKSKRLISKMSCFRKVALFIFKDSFLCWSNHTAAVIRRGETTLAELYLPSFLTMTNYYRSVIFQNLYTTITAKTYTIFLINLNLIMNKMYLKYFEVLKNIKEWGGT